ncbi:dna-directed rna polymerases i ii and iii subunit rpabc2 [Holotrichia oblita]|uniref:Dna-directed rna polymerases i ii and iii subunit rpabc2 n=1 Tax=Holotrichia oblita TaxID=644536 RepID=A0ACB9SG82_HOLOL|nr:dna-directed rna polymerases i ii and iii subunit rpabc2 [Holotrichia oblita]
MDKFKRHGDGECSEWPERKKRKEKKSSVITLAKIKGEEHVNHVGKLVNKRKTGEDCRCKRFKCFSKISTNDRIMLLQNFNSMSSKNDQDSHLCGLISIQNISRRRPKAGNHNPLKTHAAAFNYKIRINGKEEPICLQAFLSIHGITVSRVRRLQNSLITVGKSPRDKRGTHSNRPTQYPEVIWNIIEYHIKSFQGMQSHYSFRKNPNCVYLPEGLSISTMHSLFEEEYRINIPYKLYWKVFTTKFNIKFGYPRSDTCAECDTFQQKLNSTSVTEEEKAEIRIRKELHQRKAEAFHRLKRQYKATAQTGEITCLTFDFMQNLPLPHIPTNPVFFSRQLWYNVFGIHNMGTSDVSIYTYHEGEFKKGASDVASMLFHFLRTCDTTRNLMLFSDSCPGQNKNYIMLHFLYILVHCLKMFDSITYYFPMRGHSYLPNDQDFALIEKKKRTHGIIEVPEEWDDIIRRARKHPSPFKIVNMECNVMFDIKTSIDRFFRKTPKPKANIKSVRVININKTFPDVRLKDHYNGPWRHCSIRSKIPLPTELPFLPLYTGPNKISDSKITNLKSLLPFLSDETKRAFYEAIFEKQKNTCTADKEHDIDNDDNSSGCDD